MSSRFVRFVALPLAALLTVEACSARLSQPSTPAAPPPAASALPLAPQDPPARWPWVLAGLTAAAAAIALVFAFVVVPGAAKNAGRAAASGSGSDGNGGLLP